MEGGQRNISVAEDLDHMVDGDVGVEVALRPDTQGTEDLWRQALLKVVPCVVVLKVTQTRAFDTECAGSSYATGFVVDKQLGLLLTNRHVVTPGPTVAEAVFQNREEVPVYPLYYDPIHDFGFFRFDPHRLQYMTVEEVPLAPEAATVGLEVRVVGNDSGEKISILSGTLARLDRDAPYYGRRHYNDFNTFYLQAASGTKGGSSGSPVIDILGRAVALNAGGKSKAASAYYLPLQRIVRALNYLQNAIKCGVEQHVEQIRVPRGDLQTTFLFKGFDEVRRLGLRPETEHQVRQFQDCSLKEASSLKDVTSRSAGMLVVDSVVPGGPGDGVLEPGDVLVRLNGRFVFGFLEMEELLDGAIGVGSQDPFSSGSTDARKVDVEVQRGGKSVTATVQVQDLHAVTPFQFLELGGGSVHALSYQQARNARSPVGLVYVADAGYMLSKAGVEKRSIITAVGGQPTPTLEAFVAVISSLKHGQRVPLEYYTFDARFRRKQVILHVDWKWYGPPLLWKRNDGRGVWDPTGNLLGYKLPIVDTSLASTPTKKAPNSIDSRIESNNKPVCEFDEELLRAAMVQVDVEIPLVALADGVHSRAFSGCGIIVHISPTFGLVLVDRNTVTIGPGDITLSFGAFPCEVPARVRFLHPLHNFALVSFDLNDQSIWSEKARTSLRCVHLEKEVPLRRGDVVELVCLSKSLRILRRSCTVTNEAMPVRIARADVPRFRAIHEEVCKVDQDFGVAYSGILTNPHTGAVRALWCSYSEQIAQNDREWTAGLPTSVFAPWIQAVVASLTNISTNDVNASRRPPYVYVLNAELEPLLLSKAVLFGLPQEWVSKLAAVDPERRQVLRVTSTVASSDAKNVLMDGDMILAVNGQPVSTFIDVERIILQMQVDSQTHRRDSNNQHGTSSNDRFSLDLVIFRDGRIVSDPPMTRVSLGVEDGLGTDRLVHWCGAQLQAPHRAVRELGFVPPDASGVYVSRWHHGSPAHRYGMYALHWITEVNGESTPTLDDFLKIVLPIGNGCDVRLKMVHFETARVKVLTLKTDLRYWPTWELRLDAGLGEWKRVEYSFSG